MNQWLERIAPCPRVVGDHWSGGAWVEPLRVIYDHELVLFRGGDFVVTLENRKVPCPDGTFLIVPPGTRHVSRTLSPKGGHRYWVHFDWVWTRPRAGTPVLTYLPSRPSPELYRPAPPFVPARLLHGPIAAPQRVFDLHRQLRDLWNQGEDLDRLVARARLQELLVELLADRRAGDAARKAGHDLPHRVRTALDRVAEHAIADMPSVQHQLEQLGYSYAHLCRVFRQAYGLSPLQYVNALRVERAKFLIHDTRLPFAEVARRVGFSSPAYFCRQFRRQVGQSPSAYARTVRLAARP
jgi:AraC-like DNA-binding protein